MCMMLGIPQTQQARDDLRIELRDYLTLHAHEPWMWTLMCACGELDASDIDDLQDGFTPLDPLGTTTASLRDCGPLLSISTSAPAVPLPAPTSELTWPPETFDALAWHVGTTNPSIITTLRDTLPVATVLYHTDLYKAHLSAQAASDALVPLPKRACTTLRWPHSRPLDKFMLITCLQSLPCIQGWR